MHYGDITGCILAGGQGSRMGGVDKGLQLFRGQPLAAHALRRLAPQVGALVINANRHVDEYTRLAQPYAATHGALVVPDAEAGYPGPLAGFLCGLRHCATPWLLTVACDTPLFPLDLAERMLAAAREQPHTAIVVAHGVESSSGPLRAQPVFCLLRATLAPSLHAFMAGGGRKIDAWTGQHRCAVARFDLAGERHAFANANTLAELQALEQLEPKNAAR